jgi:hypothetical protein
MIPAGVRVAGLAGLLTGLAVDHPAALAQPAPTVAPAAAPQMVCPVSTYRPVVRREKVPDLLALFMPPIAILDALTRDSMANVPTRAVAFSALDAAGKPAKGAFVGLILDKGKRFLLEAPADGKPAQVPHGDYTVNVALRDADGTVRWGSSTMTVTAKGPASVKVKLTETVPAIVPTGLKDKVQPGTRLHLRLDGFQQKNATVVLSDPHATAAAGAKRVLVETQVPDRDYLSFTLPGTPGQYEALYLLCAPRVTLARWPIQVEPSDIAINAPERVLAGSPLTAQIRGTFRSGFRVEWHDDGAGVLTSRSLSKDSGAEDVNLSAPIDAGRYDIVVRTADDKVVLARRTVSVEPGEITITGPDRVGLGRATAFSFPSGPGAELQLWRVAADGKPEERSILQVSTRSVRLLVPAGAYELRLVNTRTPERRVVARKLVSVEGRAFRDMPGTVSPGQRLIIGLALTPDFFDRVKIVRRGDPFDRRDQMPEGRPHNVPMVAMEAPRQPGSYDLIYVAAEVNQAVVIERVPLEVR